MSTSTPASPPTFPPSLPVSSTSQLITQGAEALLYKSCHLLAARPCALKYRPPKPYRHAALDARLTRARILAEARVLLKCRRDGVAAPAVYALDEAAGWLMMEWVEGSSVRAALDVWLAGEKERQAQEAKAHDSTGPLARLLTDVGMVVGKLHANGIVHGDLTTSNLMLRPRPTTQPSGISSDDPADTLHGDVVLIDFGLASQTIAEEDRAVDLYVLERAFASTHPRAEDLFYQVLQGYAQSFPGAKAVLRRLEDVRMRGRKRSMLG